MRIQVPGHAPGQAGLTHACLQANLLRAYGQYSEEILEGCAKQQEYRAIVFALCYYHAAMLERKKFGVGNLPAATSGALHGKQPEARCSSTVLH